MTTPPPHYELLYHPGQPGRGEFIRLAFAAAKVPYTDLANQDPSAGYATVRRICMNSGVESADGNPPVFAPPALRMTRGGGGGGDEAAGKKEKKKSLVISQTPNILLFLGPRLGLVPGGGGEDEDEDEAEAQRFHVQQLMLTALDFNNEMHDTHHPISVVKYYEDQKESALEKARDVRENRIPKFLSYFERTLQWNADAGKQRYLVGDKLTYADTTVWQVLDGVQFSFPKEMEARKKEFPHLLGTFYESVREEKGIKEYLASERRLKYSQGIFRYYPELDRQ